MVSNCAAVRGTLQNVTAIRTLVCDNYSYDYVGARQSELYNCIFTRNRCESSGVIGATSGKAVNCTVVANETPYAARDPGTYYNCLFSFSHANDPEILNVTATANCVTETEHGNFQTLAPLFGDMRVLAGSAAETAGDPSHLAASDFSVKVPESELNRDFTGTAIDTNRSTICAGAIQTVVTAVGGGIAFSGLSRASGCGISAEGERPCYQNGVYALAASWPVQWRFDPVLAANTELFGCKSSISSANGRFRFAQPGGELLIIPPLAQGLVETNACCISKKVVWVDPKADAAAATGAEGTPYRTLQAATDAVASYDYPIIKLKRGTYAEGERFAGGISNRVHLGHYKYAKYIGVEGAANTVIVGAPDPSTGGNGPNATRLFYTSGSAQACVQGVTLTGGYTDSTTGTESAQGGVLRAGDRTFFITDSIISNNVAQNGLLVNGVVARCRILGNRPYDTLLYDTHSISCCFEDNKSTRKSLASALFTGVPMYFCTVRDEPIDEDDVYGYHASPNAFPFACVFSGGNSYNCTKGCGNLAWAFGRYNSDASGYTVVDPRFANTSGGTLKASPALTHRVAPSAANVGASIDTIASGDIDGKKFDLMNGAFAPGACHTFADKGTVTIAAAQGGIRVEGGVVGENVLQTGSLTIWPTPGPRPCVGVTVGGVTNLFADSGSIVISAAMAQAAGAIDVGAIYSNVWYVNPDPEKGGDARTGFSADDPFLTLTNAAAHAVSGDVISAAPGTYAIGATRLSGGKITRERVRIPTGVTLRSEQGAEVTTIVGAKATSPDAWGCGTDAVRCVSMAYNSTLEGFTITDGYSYGWEASETAETGGKYYGIEFCGGAILGYGADFYATTFVRDCVISNTSSFTAPTRYVTLVNCRLTENLSYHGGGAGGDCAYHGCLVGTNYGQRAVMNFFDIVNTTISGQLTYDRCAVATAINYAHSGVSLRNVLFFGYAAETTLPVAYNSYFVDGCGVADSVLGTGSALVPAAELAVDEDLRPVIGACRAVDAADMTDALVTAYLESTDASGCQRLSNGRLDVGALEADWRPRYAGDLSRSRALGVTEATENVVETNSGTVSVPGGARLTTVWRARSSVGNAVFVCKVALDGSCELVVTCDGVEVDRLSGVSGERTLSYSLPVAVQHEISFACTGDGAAEIKSLSRTSGLLLMVK